MVKRYSINLKVFVIIFFLSLLFLVLSVWIIFMFEYRQLSNNMDNEIETLKNAQYQAVVEGLWNFDYPLISALLDGFCIHPYINYASIVETSGKLIESGTCVSGVELDSYPLIREENEDSFTIGILYFQIDSHLILSDVNRHILLLILSQGIMIVLLSFAIIMLLFHYVTKPLSRLAEQISSFRYEGGLPSFFLKKKRYRDELDTLMESFKFMYQNLEKERDAEQLTVRKLSESEKVNRILVEEAPDAILMLDMDAMRFISCNNKAEKIFAMPREELIKSH